MNFSSKLLENAVNEMSQLPGIGKRTALRLVLFLLNQPKAQTIELSDSLLDLVENEPNNTSRATTRLPIHSCNHPTNESLSSVE